jgi:hypothetical protein
MAHEDEQEGIEMEMFDKDSLVIAGIIILTAFWVYMVPSQAAPMVNTVMGGLLGYLGASSKNMGGTK